MRNRPEAGGKESDREALALWVALARAHEGVSRVSRAHAAEEGLTPAAFGVLEALHHLGPLRMCDLQEKVLVSSGGVTFAVDRLVEAGLVERVPDQADRRVRRASLTAEGRARIARIFPEHKKRIARATAGLTGADRRSAIRLLRALAERAREEAP